MGIFRQRLGFFVEENVLLFEKAVRDTKSFFTQRFDVRDNA